MATVQASRSRIARPRLPAALVWTIAVPVNIGLGWLGYWAYLAIVALIQGTMTQLGMSGGVEVSLGFLPGLFIVLVAWGLYLPLLVTLNRGLLRRSSVPPQMYWAVTVLVVALAAVITGAQTYGPYFD